MSVLVHADRAIAYGEVVDVMVVLQRAGAKKVGLVTDPLPEPKQRKG
jgi:biopolymer transport protein TolR